MLEYARRNQSVMRAVATGFDMLRDDTFVVIDGFAVESLDMEIPRALSGAVFIFDSGS